METMILKGESVRDRIFSEVKNDVELLQRIYGKVPGIAFIGFTGVPLGKYNMPLHVASAQQIGFRVFLQVMTAVLGILFRNTLESFRNTLTRSANKSNFVKINM
ncbi:MAG: hypothetical protein WCO93_09095 [bacterium]